jgi:light-regulated signal transduction histidine kinase (bacteriophytochrome)
MVASYLELLKKRYFGRLDQKADEYIRYAVEGAERMQSLILDLLNYSRVGAPSQPLQMVNSQTILDKVKENLKFALQESNAVLTQDPLPTLYADPVQLTELFQNLIVNSIKFRGSEPLRIHIAVSQNKDEWIFSFHDNGIGIDEQYHDRLFVIFQRLHDREKYPGNGIGLALCKKIVERHGGRIWLQSKLGWGTTFYFSIRKKLEHASNIV